MTERKDIGGHEPDIEVVDYLYGEMTPEHRAAFERRLQEDSALRVEVARLQMLKTRLDGLPGIEPPPDLVERVLAEAHAACRKREQRENGWLERLVESFRWLLRPQAGIALAAMLVVAVGIYMAREAKQPSKPGTPEQAREQMRPLPAKSAQESPEAAPVRPGMAEGKAGSGEEGEGIGAAGKPPIGSLGSGAEGGDAKPAASDGSGKTGGAKVGDWPRAGVRSPDEPSGEEAEAVPSAEAAGKPATAESPADNGEEHPAAAPAATAGRMTGLEAAKGEGGEATAQGSGGSIAVATDSTVSDGDTGYRGSEGWKRKETGGLEKRDGAAVYEASAKLVQLDGEDGLPRDQPLAANLSATRELDKKVEANADVQFRQEKQAKAQTDMETRAQVLADEEARAQAARDEKATAAEAAAIQDVALAEKAVVVREQAGTEERAEKEESAKARVKKEGWFSDDNVAAAPAEPVVVEKRPVVTTGDLRGAGEPAAIEGERFKLEAKTTAVEGPARDSKDIGDAARAQDAGTGGTRPYKPAQIADAAKPAEEASPSPLAGPASPVLVENRYEDGKKKAAGKDAAATAGPVKVDLARDSGLLSLLLGKNAEKEETVAAGENEKAAEKGKAEQAGAMPVALDAKTKAAEEGELEVAKKEEKAQEKVDCAAIWNKLLALEKAGKNADALSLLDEFRTGVCAGYVSAETIGFKEADLYLASGQKDRARKVLNRLKMASPPAEQKAMDMLESIEK